ncbi:hypothetical protein [Psychroflexus tropicus]|uniref:hypothetical protein n=1 Tax=Psychroflexus tropicus TaxID=197345 RepID=UPI0012F8307A|nr:hypothetical protein [Psychroflexus tropicus]
MTLLVQVMSYSQIKKEENILISDSIRRYIIKNKAKIDSLKKINYINRKYEYLDSTFKITISSNKFQTIIDKRIKEVKNYNDSLMVVLLYELKDDNAVNIAFHRILYSWEKVGFHIWETPENAKKISNGFGINHPYEFMNYLYDEKKDILKDFFLMMLTDKLKAYLKTDTFTFDNKQLLKTLYKNNPRRIKLYKKYVKNKSIHSH